MARCTWRSIRSPRPSFRRSWNCQPPERRRGCWAMSSPAACAKRARKWPASRGGAVLRNIGGESNWFCGDFSARETGLDAKRNHFEPAADDLFLGPRDDNYRLTPQAAQRMTVLLRPSCLNCRRRRGCPTRLPCGPWTGSIIIRPEARNAPRKKASRQGPTPGLRAGGRDRRLDNYVPCSAWVGRESRLPGCAAMLETT